MGPPPASVVPHCKFPEGMRVLVVDDNPVCLKIATTLLHKCPYEVTAMSDMVEALTVLKQNNEKFDIVLTNVRETSNNINGFHVLEAGLEHDIPVVLTSATDDVETVKKGVTLGAQHYLFKPLGFPEIKNLWQHVVRNNLHKHKRINNNNNNNCNIINGIIIKGQTEEKKQRVRWDRWLHEKFEDAVVKLGGLDKAVPIKILELMNVEGLTREQVASHLQKQRKSIKNNNVSSRVDNQKKLMSNVVDSEQQQSVNLNVFSTVRPSIGNNNNNLIIGGRQVVGLGGYSNQWMFNHGINNCQNYHFLQQQQQQQQQNQWVFGDFRPNSSEFFDFGANNKKMNNEFFDPVCENINGLFDGELDDFLI